MNRETYATKKSTCKWLGALCAVVLIAGTAGANQRLVIPDEHPGPPIYTKGFSSWDSGWSATVFYRDPACVPPDFNLLNLLDFGLLNPPPGCEILMEGFGIWNGPPYLPPIQEVLQNGGVPIPIWFVSMDETLAMKSDGVITIGELEEQTSLIKGEAHFYSEVLQAEGSAQVPSFRSVAIGVLEDGRAFFMQAVSSPSIYMVQIFFE